MKNFPSLQQFQLLSPCPMTLRMRWPRTKRNSRLPTAVFALAVAAAIAHVESKLKKTCRKYAKKTCRKYAKKNYHHRWR